MNVAPPAAGYVFQQSSMVVQQPGQKPININMVYESQNGKTLQNELKLQREGKAPATMHITDGVRLGRPLAQKRFIHQIQAYVKDDEEKKAPETKAKAKGKAKKK